MMKKFVFIFTIFMAISFSWAEDHPSLEGIVKPVINIVKNDKMYVLQRATIYIYSLKDFRLIKKFGREGEGPKEFKTRPFGPPMSMSFVKGELAVNSMNKLSFFTSDGEYLREIKAGANLVYYPVMNNFITIGPAAGDDKKFMISYRIFDTAFKEKKRLFRTSVDVGNPNRFDMPLCAFTYNPVYKDKLYILGSETEFIINVFDAEGKLEYQIKNDYEKIKISAAFKKMTHHWFKTDPLYKRFYETIKSMIYFWDHFPAMRDIHITEDSIFVISHKRKGNLWECIQMDLKGKIKGRTFVPLSEYLPYTYYPLLYSVYKGKMYSLIENEDEEVWKVHITKLN